MREFTPLHALSLHDAHWQFRLGLEREFHVIGKEAFEFCRAKIRARSDLNDRKLSLCWQETLRSKGLRSIGVCA